jgi:hypothetical protein
MKQSYVYGSNEYLEIKFQVISSKRNIISTHGKKNGFTQVPKNFAGFRSENNFVGSSK